MKKLTTSLTLAVAIITSLSGVAAADTCSRVPLSRDHYEYRHIEHVEYHVEYYACTCGKWRCYGVYDHKCEAAAVARKLARQGLKVRIALEIE